MGQCCGCCADEEEGDQLQANLQPQPNAQHHQQQHQNVRQQQPNAQRRQPNVQQRQRNAQQIRHHIDDLLPDPERAVAVRLVQACMRLDAIGRMQINLQRMRTSVVHVLMENRHQVNPGVYVNTRELRALVDQLLRDTTQRHPDGRLTVEQDRLKIRLAAFLRANLQQPANAQQPAQQRPANVHLHQQANAHPANAPQPAQQPNVPQPAQQQQPNVPQPAQQQNEEQPGQQQLNVEPPAQQQDVASSSEDEEAPGGGVVIPPPAAPKKKKLDYYEYQRMKEAEKRARKVPAIRGDPNACAICMDSSKDARAGRRQMMRTACNHLFCERCIVKWTKKEGHDTCPMCRTRCLTESDPLIPYRF